MKIFQRSFIWLNLENLFLHKTTLIDDAMHVFDVLALSFEENWLSKTCSQLSKKYAD